MKKKPEVGDLVRLTNGKLLLVMAMTKHKKTWQRKVLVFLCGDGKPYWLNLEYLIEMIQDTSEVEDGWI